MKICLVQQHPVIPGKIPAAILRWVKLAEHFSRRHEVVLIMPGKGRRIQRGEFMGLPAWRVPQPGWGGKAFNMLFFSLLLFPVLLLVRRREKPDLYFVDELFVAPGLVPFHWLFHPLVNYDVMGIHKYQVKRNNRKLSRHLLLSNLYYLLDRLTIHGSTFLTTVNRAHREKLREWTRKPIYVIRDAAEFPTPVEKIPKGILPEKKPGSVRLTFVGKISNNRLDDLFAVLPELLAELPQLEVLIVGDGPFGEKYRRWAQELPHGGRIRFTGFLAHELLPLVGRETDIAYSDDWSEIGFPMKVFEYMHLGLAMLVEDTPAVREVLKHERDAWLYRGREGLARGIRLLAAREELRRRLGEAARAEAEREHKWEQRVQQFEELYAAWLRGERPEEF